MNIPVNIALEEVLTYEEINKIKKKEDVVKKTAIAGASVGALFVASMAVPKVPSSTPTVEKKVVVQKEAIVVKEEKPKVLSEVVYSSEKEFGKVLKTDSGKLAVGTITKDEHNRIYETFIRPISSKSINVTYTAGLVEETEKYNPYVTYKTNKESKVFAPQNGRVIEVKSNEVVLEHNIENKNYYSILKGVSAEVKKGAKVLRGEIIGQTDEVKFTIAKNYDKGEYFEYIHPNRVVDTDGSDSYPYGSYKYYQQDSVKLSPKLKGTKTEEAFNKLPDEVKNSNVLKGVVIENKDQLKILKSNPIYYSNDVLPLELIENGKATVSPQVRALEPLVREAAKENRVEEMTEFLLALLQQESGGIESVLATDPFQSSQSKNEKIGSITDQKESIQQGVSHFVSMLNMNKMFEPIHHGDIRQAIQSYNFGGRITKIANEKELGYSVKYVQEMSKELAVEYNKPIGEDWRGVYAYGDFTYTSKVLNYFEPATDWKDKSKQAENEARKTIEVERQAKEQAKEKVVQEAKKAKPQPAVKAKSNEKEDIVEAAYENYEDKIKSLSSDYKAFKVADLEKSNKLAGKTIVIDAGHGGHDGGASGIDDEGTNEKEINLQHSKKIQEALSNQGANVIMTRTTDGGFLKPAERGHLANNQKADLTISVHSNSAVVKAVGAATGFEVLYKPSTTDNTQFAKEIHNQLKTSLGVLPDRGTVVRNDLAVLNTSKSPTVLIELGFVTNPYDLTVMLNKEVQNSVANSIAKAAINYLGVNTEPEEVEKVTEDVEIKKEANTDSKVPVEESTKVEEKETEKDVVTEDTKPKADVDVKVEEKEAVEDSENKKEEKQEQEIQQNEEVQQEQEVKEDESKKDEGFFLFDLFKDKDNQEEKIENPSDSEEEVKEETKTSQVNNDDDLFIWNFINKLA